LTIPIQALVQRVAATEKALADNGGKPPTGGTVTAANALPAAKGPAVQGVYVLKTDHKKLRAVFIPVKTGVTGATEIEVLNGLKQDDEIVTGRYKTLRTLKSGTPVKRDNTPETEAEKS
jgi:HlyD family secretion protein